MINAELAITIGGSADLTPSNNTKTKNISEIKPGDFSGRYIHYGIREHGMVAAMNGMALHGGVIPYGGTFFVFSDYCRPAIRLAALMGIRVVFVMTHDSIGVGEDGPTHQPVEQLAAMRAMPGLLVMRPCDGVETAECWQLALENTKRPSLIAFSRQDVPTARTVHTDSNLSARGAYELVGDSNAKVTFLSTGSEISIALAARDLLAREGIGARIVSMPCWDLFEEQDEAFRKKLMGELPRVAIEAAAPLWLGPLYRTERRLCRHAFVRRQRPLERRVPAFQHHAGRSSCGGKKIIEEIKMALRVAINGFGRIGRLVLRAIVESGRRDIEIVAVNDLGPIETNAHLLRYDSVHGRFPATVTVDGDVMVAAGHRIKVTCIKNPAELPHKALDVDIAHGMHRHLHLQGKSLGAFDRRRQAGAGQRALRQRRRHRGLWRQSRQVDQKHLIVSNASCTTNCLVPVAKVLNDAVGIQHGMMTTIHSYTNDQPTLDQLHKDLYRARAAALSMIPTSTGAAKAVGLVLPELKGKLDGISVRVPTPNVSLVDLKFVAKRPTSVEEINNADQGRRQSGPLKGILEVVHDKLVSVDFNGNPVSSSFALEQTKVMEGTFVSVMAWYDNEWGFSNRMADTAVAMGKLI